KAFRVFNSKTRIVQETLHINFLENKPNVAGIGPKWLFDIDTLTMSMNYQPVVAGNQPNNNADPQNTDDDVVDAAFDVKENESDVHVSANGSDKSDSKKHNENAKRDDKGKSSIDSPTGVKDLRAEFEEFPSNSTNRVNAVSAPITVTRPNSTNSTNSFNTASPPDIAVSLNFRIAEKSSFVDPSKYPDDLGMPKLEDIVYSDDEEDVGAEADLSNLETNISVIPIPTTRVHKDHPVIQIIVDLTSASQTRSMTRMVKEHGELHQINDEDFYTCFMVYQMNVKSAFLYENIEEEIYVYQPLGFKDPDYLDKVYKVVKALYGLHQAPRAWYETLANYLLENGLQVKQKDDGIFISQDKYVAKILRKFGFINVKSASTPIETEKPLLEDPNVKRIFRYLKGKPHLGLWYHKDSPFNMVAYSDSDYAGASLDRKSTTSGCQFLGCRLISWQCEKETVVATSSTKAEYVAASCCA
nr:hypothetical protein [Tanacetum cinerariifolium]